MGLLVFETRPKGRGREDSAEDVSQRNWTTEQTLPAPTTFRKVPVLGHTATNPVPILFLHPFTENPKRKYRFLGDPPHFQSGSSSGTQAPVPPSLSQPRTPRLAAEWHRRGWGSSTPRGPRFSSHALLQLAIAPSPTDTPFLRR